ncbi:MAG: TolC family protein [Acidobacteriota bacterium]
MLRIFGGLFLIPLVFELSYAQTITSEEFLQLVELSHPFFAKEALSPQIEGKGREGFLGAQDWTIRSSSFLAHQKPISTGAFFPTRINSVGLGAAVGRAFWNTGGRLSLSWSYDFTDQSLPDIVVPLSSETVVISAGPAQLYRHGVFLAYSQPLLQNYGGRLDRLDYELGGYTIGLTELRALENQEGFLLELGVRFLDWVLLTEQTRIANERLRLAEEELEQSKRKRAANLVDRVDVLRAEDAVRIAKQNVVLIESQWRAKQAELAVLAQSDELYDRSPEFDLYSLESLPPTDEAVLRLEERSRLLQALGLRREQLSHLRGGFVETSRPQLFLGVSAGLQSGEPEFGGSMVLDKPDVSVSLEYRYPLGNRTARAGIEKTALQLRQVEEESKDVSLDLQAGVRSVRIQIQHLESVLALNREQIESAKEKTEEELRLYNQGRGELTFVIQSRDNEENAKLTYAQNATGYHKLVLQYRALTDELLPSSRRDR